MSEWPRDRNQAIAALAAAQADMFSLMDPPCEEAIDLCAATIAATDAYFRMQDPQKYITETALTHIQATLLSGDKVVTEHLSQFIRPRRGPTSGGRSGTTATTTTTTTATKEDKKPP